MIENTQWYSGAADLLLVMLQDDYPSLTAQSTESIAPNAVVFIPIVTHGVVFLTSTCPL